jgi:hypothetical protein
MFLLVQLYLHPSANRWGALSETEMHQALSVFGVFLLGSIAFWAWFNLIRPTPSAHEDDPETATV